mgnify:FL=1|tara:strand:+ start:389 stop:1036 length:648 start_codon:yes stop_codon:yes gene_type:complete
MAIGNPITLTTNIASKTISEIATASQTSFNVTGGYRINQISVYRNGVRLVSGRDYTALDGATVTLLSAASLNDVIEFHIFDDFQVADAIQSVGSEQTLSGNLTITGTLTGTGAASTEFRAAVGVSSAGTVIGAGITQLNFIGAGNTFAVTGNTMDVSISGGAMGGGGNRVFFENDITVTNDYEITTGKNAMSAGPLTINSGVTITIPSGSDWTIV